VKKKFKKFDRILVMGWQTFDKVKFLPKRSTMIGVHSHRSWDSDKTTPESDVVPPKNLVDFLSTFFRVNAVSTRLYNIFKSAGLTNLHLTRNGVDTSLFLKNKGFHSSKGFTVGYSGSKAHDTLKGISKFILPAAKKSKVKVKLAMRGDNNYLPLEKMPYFYNEIDCYICASSCEGSSISMLEAAACARPIISTRVGGIEYISDGCTGFLVKRNVNEIVDKIRVLRYNPDVLENMSNDMRKVIEDSWCWRKRVNDWIKFLAL